MKQYVNKRQQYSAEICFTILKNVFICENKIMFDTSLGWWSVYMGLLDSR